ncbi:MAG: hypothetical protein WBD20_20075 [Pirellulaceae bacterium]
MKNSLHRLGRLKKLNVNFVKEHLRRSTIARLRNRVVLFVVFLCFATFSFAPSVASDCRVVATRDLSGGSEVEYQVLVEVKGRYVSCFHANAGPYTWIRAAGSDFKVHEGGDWSLSYRNQDKSMLCDNNGDGLFDAYYRQSVRIRFGNQLVEIEEIKALPWASAVEVVDSGQPREFTFVQDRFVISSDQSMATGLCYSIPNAKIPNAAISPDPGMLNEELVKLTWRTPDFWVPSAREYVSIPFRESSSFGGVNEIAFRALHGVPVEVSLKNNNVAKWKYGDVYSQEFHRGKNDSVYCSKFVVGAFEYTDHDGDGIFDSFYNSDANELIEIRLESLVRGKSQSYQPDWLLYTGVVIIILSCFIVFRHCRKRAALMDKPDPVDNAT